MGKGILDEHSPLFGGCYAGANSLDPVKKELEASDFVLYVGALKSDFNSGSFSVHIPTQNTIRLHSFTTNVGFASFPTTDIRHVLPKLVPAFERVASETKIPVIRDSLEQKMKEGRVEKLTDKVEGKEIVHAWVWRRLGSWFKDNGERIRVRPDRRHRHYGNRHVVLRSAFCPHPQPRTLRRSDSLGCYWMVSWSNSWLCPCC